MVDKEVCLLPFYNNKKTLDKTWVLGGIVLDNHYTVFDLTPTDGSLSVGIARKNPLYVYPQPSAGGGGAKPIHDKLKRNIEIIVGVFVIVALGIFAGVQCQKRRQARQMDPNFNFEFD